MASGKVLTAEEAAGRLQARRMARTNLEAYALHIDIPGAPTMTEGDNWAFSKLELPLAKHHRLITRAVQSCMERPYGRLMLMLPPGAAKSTYASAVAPSWRMGRKPGSKIILLSHSSGIAEKHAKRAQKMCMSKRYEALFEAKPVTFAKDDWSMSNDSTMLAGGIETGISGERADGLICDDLIAGRQKADSEATRKQVWEAYKEDAMTRLIPGGWHVMIGTRWHMDDPMGRILPDDYDGRSGMIKCKDGKVWEVLCIPACCDRADDPMGRQMGEYLWPEWFDDEYWALHRDDPTNARAWSSLFQQRPVPESGGQFESGYLDFYDTPPTRFMRLIGASDWAVTERRTADWTEHGVFGIDSFGGLWELDWWGGQVSPDKGIDEFIRLVKKWKKHGLAAWLGEKGVIENAIGSARDSAMRQEKAYVNIELLPSVGDKIAKVASFRAMARQGKVHFRRPTPGSHTQRVVTQLYQFPAGRFDDGVDVCGMAGRYASEIKVKDPEKQAEEEPIKPFTSRWLHWTPPTRAKKLNTV